MWSHQLAFRSYIESAVHHSIIKAVKIWQRQAQLQSPQKIFLYYWHSFWSWVIHVLFTFRPVWSYSTLKKNCSSLPAFVTVKLTVNVDPGWIATFLFGTEDFNVGDLLSSSRRRILIFRRCSLIFSPLVPSLLATVLSNNVSLMLRFFFAVKINSTRTFSPVLRYTVSCANCPKTNSENETYKWNGVLQYFALRLKSLRKESD